MAQCNCKSFLLLLAAIAMGITIYAACSLDDDDFGASQSELESNADGVLDLRSENSIVTYTSPIQNVNLATFNFGDSIYDTIHCSYQYILSTSNNFSTFNVRVFNYRDPRIFEIKGSLGPGGGYNSNTNTYSFNINFGANLVSDRSITGINFQSVSIPKTNFIINEL